MMRIITGSARGTHLYAPEGLTTRPTSERAKQGVYNILQFSIEGRRVLDLFAGSGQMGLEALSRGAKEAVFADYDKDALACIRKNIDKTHMQDRATVLEGDYKTVLRGLEGKAPFDLIFLDPPYRSDYLSSALTLLKKYRLVAPSAYIVCESGGALPTLPYGLSLFRSVSYGKNAMHILVTKEEDVQ